MKDWLRFNRVALVLIVISCITFSVLVAYARRNGTNAWMEPEATVPFGESIVIDDVTWKAREIELRYDRDAVAPGERYVSIVFDRKFDRPAGFVPQTTYNCLFRYIDDRGRMWANEKVPPGLDINWALQENLTGACRPEDRGAYFTTALVPRDAHIVAVNVLFHSVENFRTIRFRVR